MKPQIGVIGLGKFGRSCAIRLAELGFDVLAIDETQANVDSIKDDVALAVVADTTDPAELEAAGIANCDTVVLTIGAEIERSVLTAAVLKEMGIRHLVARASSDLHGRLLMRIGADDVVFPEHDMAVRLANRLSLSSIYDFLESSPDYDILEVPIPRTAAGKTLRDLDYRARFEINVVGIRRGGEILVTLHSDDILELNDRLIILGSVANLHRFASQTRS
jgi:trk system potassium uptake protein TrkA